MKEIQGDAWDFWGKAGYMLCLLTNGFVKKNGDAVMGRGIAYEATQRVPNMQKHLGDYIKVRGNVCGILRMEPCEFSFVVFPTKHNWFENSNLDLIKQSAERLSEMAKESNFNFVLPRPGCGNGKLNWEDVKPVIEFLPDNVLVIDRGL